MKHKIIEKEETPEQKKAMETLEEYQEKRRKERSKSIKKKEILLW